MNSINADKNKDTKLCAITSTSTHVVNVKVSNIKSHGYNNLLEWMSNEKDNIYIGRGRIVFIDGVRFPPTDSMWANPFKINKNQSREEVLLMYSEYIEKKLESDNNLINELLKLKGKNLGCWCKPKCCHGDILIKMIEKYNK